MRKRSKLGMLLAGAVACAGLLVPQAQAATVIDLFNDDAQSITASTTTSTVHDTVSGGSYLGGFRELYAELNDGSSLTMIVDTTGSGVVFDLAHPSSAPTRIDPDLASITWDGVGGALGGAPDTTVSLGNFGALNSFYVETNEFNEANRFVNIEVWDEFGASANAELTLAQGVTDHYLNFGNFGGFDFSDVRAIRMHFLTDDIEISTFSAVVPVPPAVGLGLVGLFIAGGRLRRRKKNQA